MQSFKDEQIESYAVHLLAHYRLHQMLLSPCQYAKSKHLAPTAGVDIVTGESSNLSGEGLLT